MDTALGAVDTFGWSKAGCLRLSIEPKAKEKMKFFKLFKTTALGGFVFLLPFIVFVFLITKSHQIISKITTPLLDFFSVQRLLGVEILNILTFVVLLLICYIAGLVARTQYAKNTAALLESAILSKIPAYELAKVKTTTKLRYEGANTITVLVRFDDQWRMGIEVERTGDSKVVVYLPGSPDPWSGSITIVTESRVKRLASKQLATLSVFEHLGQGASEQLKDGIQ